MNTSAHRSRKNWSHPLTLMVLLVAACSATLASDLEKEKRWADQIIQQLFDGEVVWLETDEVRFLGLYTQARSEPKGSVIILHGIGAHPDWPQVINPLRIGLAEKGWNTLSVQLPILPNEAAPREYLPLLDEVPPRMDAAARFLRTRDTGPLFLVAHSLGVLMALHYLEQNGANGIAGLVALGSSSGSETGPDTPADGFSGLRLPILDLYGEFDLEMVLTGVATRASVVQASGNTDFTQTRLPGADHFFDGYEAALLAEVSSWLEARR